MSKLYLAVTPDRYELPIAVCTSSTELARLFGLKPHTVQAELSRPHKGELRGAKFIRIEMEEENESTK